MAKAFDPKAKAKRQKIVAAVGGVILVALLVWRVPQVIALMNKKPPPAPSSSASAAPAPAPATPGLPAVAPTPGGAVPASAALVDTDVAPTPDAGQLVSFGRFVSKDPFAQQLAPRSSETAAAGGGGGKPHKPVNVPEPVLEPVQPATPKSSTASTARISVNGEVESVSAGSTFPASDPLFKLVSVGRRSAKIAIDGGSYASGESTITIEKGKPVTLVNTADGTRYRLVLV